MAVAEPVTITSKEVNSINIASTRFWGKCALVLSVYKPMHLESIRENHIESAPAKILKRTIFIFITLLY